MYCQGLSCMTYKHMCVQYIADDANTPHVGSKMDRFVLDDLGRHELRSSKQHPGVDVWIVDARQAEVDDLDAISRLCETQNVFRLKQPQLLSISCRLNYRYPVRFWLHHVQMLTTITIAESRRSLRKCFEYTILRVWVQVRYSEIGYEHSIFEYKFNCKSCLNGLFDTKTCETVKLN